MKPTDEDLVRSLAGGQEDALRKLVERHEGRVCRYFRRRLPRFEDAEEASQDVFVKIARGARTFDGQRTFRPWLSGIARNVLRDRLRSRRGVMPIPLLGEPQAHLEVYEQEVRGETVRAALGRLPSAYRAALTLKYLAGMTYREAAHELGLTEKGFETRLLRAKVKLRRELLRRGVNHGA